MCFNRCCAEVELIKILKARYFRFLDTKQWMQWRNLFADDAVIGPLETGNPHSVKVNQSADEFVDAVSRSLADVTTVHHGHMPEIEIISDMNANGVWAMEDFLEYPAGAPIRRLHGYGYYHETYSRVEEGWKIQSMQITRIRVDLKR